MNKLNKFNVLNAIMFQIGWFSAILLPLFISMPIIVLILFIHFKLVEDKQREVIFVLTVAGFGYLMDSFYSFTGKLNLALDGGSTIYLLLIWLLFAMTLRWSFRFVLKSPLWSGIIGLLAPLSYLAAQQFAKVKYSDTLSQSVIFHALLWGIFMLLVQKFLEILNKHSQIQYETK